MEQFIHQLQDLLQQTIVYLVPTVGAFIVAKVGKLLADWKKATDYRTLAEIYDIIGVIINSLYQEFIKDLKDTGNFDADAKAKFKETAIQIIKNTLKKHQHKLLKKVFSDMGSLETIIGTLIENKIYDNKTGHEFKTFFRTSF